MLNQMDKFGTIGPYDYEGDQGRCAAHLISYLREANNSTEDFGTGFVLNLYKAFGQ